MKKVWDHDICNKWPAARALGPQVLPEQALEYVLRTDPHLIHAEYACNDRTFCKRLEALIGIGWDLLDPYKEALGHLSLHHLESNWIATAYIGGPNGLVSPVGSVSLAKNFGKWPNIGEIESDLEVLSQAFPWLAFDLWLWDSPEEAEAVKFGVDPTHAWSVKKGKWQRVPTQEACQGKVVPSPMSVEAMVSAIAFNTRRETTWTIEQIDELFGDKIRSAAAHAKATSAQSQIEERSDEVDPAAKSAGLTHNT